MTILLVRHGETAGNRDRVMQTTEVPLSEQGLAQAERLAERLASSGVGLILSSDLARAEMTARAVERRTGSPLELDPLLQERNFGDLRGTPYSALSGDPFAPDYEPPAGESWKAFHQRVDGAWRRIVERSSRVDGALVVVTHGLVCHSLCLRHLALPAGAPAGVGPDGPPMRFGNTALTVIESDPPWRVSRLACTAHLERSDDVAPV
jgi:probable phosphoglycerate mutase